MKITRRYGIAPAQRGCGLNNSCPDVLRMENGDFLVIGKVPNSNWISPVELLAHGADIGDDEAAVVVPAEVVLAAAREIALESRAGAGNE